MLRPTQTINPQSDQPAALPRPTVAEVSQRIEDWHDGLFPADQLHQALGWTEAEYAAWVSDNWAIPHRPLPQAAPAPAAAAPTPAPQPDPDLARLIPLLGEIGAALDGDGITTATTIDGDLNFDELDRIELANGIEALFGLDLPLDVEEDWTTVADVLKAIATAKAGVAP